MIVVTDYWWKKIIGCRKLSAEANNKLQQIIGGIDYWWWSISDEGGLAICCLLPCSRAIWGISSWRRQSPVSPQVWHAADDDDEDDP